MHDVCSSCSRDPYRHPFPSRHLNPSLPPSTFLSRCMLFTAPPLTPFKHLSTCDRISVCTFDAAPRNHPGWIQRRTASSSSTRTCKKSYVQAANLYRVSREAPCIMRICMNEDALLKPKIIISVNPIKIYYSYNIHYLEIKKLMRFML